MDWRLFISYIFIGLLSLQCHQPSLELDQKIRVLDHDKQCGIHVFGKIDTLGLEELQSIHANWITLVPFADQEDIDSPTIRYLRSDPEKIKQRKERWTNTIHLAHNRGFKVFLKPHIWIYNPSQGKWRSDIYHDDEAAWATWKSDYRDFILYYARIAEETDVEMFCIGTEFTRLSIEKPDFWISLIKDVREIYRGKLSYAANWYQEYERVSFWDQLDYIGIQAYFPVSEKENPDIKSLQQRWAKIAEPIKAVSIKNKKAILFTELGYKSTSDATVRPWEWINYSDDTRQNYSLETQANAYSAFFNTIWKEKWFAGVHLWQWRADHRVRGDRQNLDFTPKGKPAQAIISNAFQLNTKSNNEH